jgi:allantoinase
MKNPPYTYWPSVGRPPISWPEGRSMAFYVALNVESFVPGVPGTGLGPAFALPMDVMNQSWRDYGTRVGIWRMMDLLDKHDLRASVLLNSKVCQDYPQIIEAGVARKWAWLGHGISNSYKWADMEPEDEGQRLDGIVAEFKAATGSSPKGWLGPAFTETPNTLPLLAERGFTYSLGWATDDQPYPLDVDGHRFISVPYPTEINDISAYLIWHWTPQEFAQAILDQFATLYQESKSRPGAVMALSIHPFLSNTPFRNGYLDKVLQHIRAHDDVWFPTADEIADHYLANHYDTAVTAIADSRRTKG